MKVSWTKRLKFVNRVLTIKVLSHWDIELLLDHNTAYLDQPL
jgi:hypothetical protein